MHTQRHTYTCIVIYIIWREGRCCGVVGWLEQREQANNTSDILLNHDPRNVSSLSTPKADSSRHKPCPDLSFLVDNCINGNILILTLTKLWPMPPPPTHPIKINQPYQLTPGMFPVPTKNSTKWVRGRTALMNEPPFSNKCWLSELASSKRLHRRLVEKIHALRYKLLKHNSNNFTNKLLPGWEGGRGVQCTFLLDVSMAGWSELSTSTSKDGQHSLAGW